jgi:hypothetical protein
MCDRPKRYRRSRRVLPLVDGGHEPAYYEVPSISTEIASADDPEILDSQDSHGKGGFQDILEAT